jgi:hypothetical protein
MHTLTHIQHPQHPNHCQIKFLKLLQLYPPPADANQADRLTESLRKILTHTAVSETVNKSNADHAILFEAVNLVLSHGRQAQPALRNQALTLLGRFISVKEPNIRYLGLEALGRFAQLEQLGEGGLEGIKKHQATVFVSLKVRGWFSLVGLVGRLVVFVFPAGKQTPPPSRRQTPKHAPTFHSSSNHTNTPPHPKTTPTQDADVSVRRQALDLVFAMCDSSNAQDIVGELTTNLATADAAIREEMVGRLCMWMCGCGCVCGCVCVCLWVGGGGVGRACVYKGVGWDG